MIFSSQEFCLLYLTSNSPSELINHGVTDPCDPGDSVVGGRRWPDGIAARLIEWCASGVVVVVADDVDARGDVAAAGARRGTGGGC